MRFCLIVAASTLASCCSANIAIAKKLPTGVLKVLTPDENEYCDRFLGDFRKGCRQSFRSHLTWRRLNIRPKGKSAILVEDGTSCGSAGCALLLFCRQPTGEFVQVLGPYGDVGSLKRITVLGNTTRGYYDIQKTWHDGITHTIYSWDGGRYVAHDNGEISGGRG